MTLSTDRKPRNEKSPRNEDKQRIDEERPLHEAIIEDAGETGDGGRDLAHGDGGTIDLPARPGDLSKDD